MKKNPFGKWRFTTDDGCRKLCAWLTGVVNGERPGPLVIKGPMCSGKTTLLRVIQNLLRGVAGSAPLARRDVIPFWEDMHLERCVVIDDASRWRGDGTFDIVRFVAAAPKMAKTYARSEGADIVVFRANAALAVATSAKASETLSDTYFGPDATVVQLEPIRPASMVGILDECRKWLVYASAGAEASRAMNGSARGKEILG